MSGQYGVPQFLEAARQQRTALQGELSRQEEERGRHTQNLRAVTASLDAARADLARSLLPSLTPELVAKAIQMTGYAPWRHRGPLEAMESEQVGVGFHLKTIESRDLFAKSELYFHPSTGSVTRELTEVTAHLATQQQVLAMTQAHPRFAHLFQVGYGTDAYDTPFWRVSYYDDWKAGDEILEQFPGKTFEEVRAVWAEASQAATTLDDERQRLAGLVRQGRAIWDEHEATKQKLARLPNDHLVAAQKRLLEHVLTSHGPTMLGALARDPALPNLYLRTTALAAKLLYLESVFSEHVTKPRAAIQEQLAKLDRDEVKYRRPKNFGATFPAESFQRRFADRRRAYDKRWRRYNDTYVTIWGYDRWDRVPMDRDFLWWDVMTNGRYDGDYVPSVDDWHRRHGRPTYLDDHRDRDHHEAAAAAAIAIGRDDDALSDGHDVS